MDTAAPGQFAQEDYFISRFFIGDMVVFNSVELFFQFIQLMVMSGKKSEWLMWGLVQVFNNTPCNRYTIVSGSSSSDLIKED